MSNLTDVLRDAALDALWDTKLSDLSDPNVLELLGDLTLREVIQRAANKRGRGRSRTTETAAVASAGSRKRRAPNLRTREGRDAYDVSVLRAVQERGEPVAIEEVASAAGGGLTQVRAALHRLRRARKVKRTGKTRATRYSV